MRFFCTPSCTRRILASLKAAAIPPTPSKSPHVICPGVILASKIVLLGSKIAILGCKIGFYGLQNRFWAALGPFGASKFEFLWISA